ncbi:hypothetical protein FPV67DRAFT_1500359 [Lyophyllum atratum]|nr:hypothetical protein FPV67DRAFT_1500359 [Lyophyllum atratum]
MINKPVPGQSPDSPSPLPSPSALSPEHQWLPPYPLFPSRPLVALNMVSCALSFAAFISSIAAYMVVGVDRFIMPNTIGFTLTVPFHIYLYRSARTHRQTPSHVSPVFLKTHDIIYMFCLVSVWVFIFFLNVTSADGVGGIMAAVWSGMAWPTLLLIALMCTREVSRIDAIMPDLEIDAPGDEEAGTTRPPHRGTSYIFFASMVLSTVTTMVFAYEPTVLYPLNIFAYLATAPHHAALFVTSVRKRADASLLLARPTPLSYAFFLVSLWCCVFIVDVTHNSYDAPTYLFQKIVAGVCGGLECVVVITLAVQRVLDNLGEGEIKLV